MPDCVVKSRQVLFFERYAPVMLDRQFGRDLALICAPTRAQRLLYGASAMSERGAEDRLALSLDH